MSSSLFHTLNISRQDMLSRLNDLSVTSNNLANINTAGYKKDRMIFDSMLNSAKNPTPTNGTLTYAPVLSGFPGLLFHVLLQRVFNVRRYAWEFLFPGKLLQRGSQTFL